MQTCTETAFDENMQAQTARIAAYKAKKAELEKDKRELERRILQTEVAVQTLVLAAYEKVAEDFANMHVE